MFNYHASASSPILDSPSKVDGLIFLNSPSRWSTYFLILYVFVLSLAEGVPLDELSHFSASGPKFLEALLLTSSPWLSSFGVFFLTILCNGTLVISYFSCCAFLSFSLSALKTCNSITRFLIISKTSVGEILSLFCVWYSGGLCPRFSSTLIFASSSAAMINTE